MLIKKGVYFISGPLNIKFISGEVESIGRKFIPNEEVFVPEGKRIPLEVNSQEAVIETDDTGKITELPSRTIPDDWDRVVEYIISKRINSVIIFGEVDTGKTFFSTYLTNKLLSFNVKPSVLDCDTGQSDIGPPSTLGIAVFDKPILFMTEIEPTKLYFVGSHSPAEHFLHYLCGFTKLLNFGLKNSNVVIIDTPGWVLGDGGRMLRNSEIEILSALGTNYLVILLERNKEIEHLVRSIPQERIMRLTVSKKASPTSTDERKKLREFVYKKYFSELEDVEFSFQEIFTDRSYFLTGEKIENKTKIKSIKWLERLPGFEGLYVVSSKQITDGEKQILQKVYNVKKIRNPVVEDFKNVIVALLDGNHEFICLAIIKDIDFVNSKIYLTYPKRYDVRDVKIIQFGSLKLTPEAKENGFVEPGIL
ncbi:MAG: Clp1/GlmU family protein [Endomicrobia bacterium]|nr:Clp1/GlmU family protein [Endomicrobiia bacterium]MCX7940957.1 Clp1/GlmU family protein [Endomicrobiia bacterium]MDW8055642.1 Clp1/GlmU family protein [Elusimicrobiota bacterium]